MKYLACLVVISIFFASCHKDRTCVCTRSDNATKKTYYEISVSKKSEAEEKCNQFLQTYGVYYSSCELE